jgi:hypothetical protein
MQINLLAQLALAVAAVASIPAAHADHRAEPGEPRFTTLVVFGFVPTFVSINNRRMITGSFLEPDPSGEGSRTRGFALLDRFLDPVDLVPDFAHATLLGSNDRGEIVGLLSRADGTPDGSEIGFRYTRGAVQDVSVPGSHSTTTYDINNRGDMVGITQILSSGEHGYLLSGDQLTLIDGPESDGTTRTFGIQVFGVNDRREVAGCYEPRGTIFERRAFIFRRGNYEIFQVPGAARTCAFAINNRGQIAGYYSTGGTGDPHYGFVFSKGRYIPVAIPNSRETVIRSINDFGDIVGIYVDDSFVSHAFKSNIREFMHRR